MSKRETPMTRRYWERVRGTLMEEYLIVPSSPGVGWRRVDGIIIEDGAHRIASGAERRSVSLDGHDLIIVQTKASRLGMYLLGQAFFSRELVKERFAPRSVRTVALCAADDAILRPIAERFGVEVIIDDLAVARENEQKSFSLCFDTNTIEAQLDTLSSEALQTLMNKITYDADCSFLDIFIADLVPAVRTGDSDQVIIGLNLSRATE